MAKSPRAALTRIATTITLKNYTASGADSGFYLDGRLSGRREQKSADITLDREDRGFFFSVYASLAGRRSPENAKSRTRGALDRIMNDVKQPGRNIDAEINELAECAVNVAGRISLQQEGVNQPYFAGIVVRDSELAAVTMGSGCAYLYRGDILYPLTSDDYPLEAIDMNGKPVNGIDIYCAGVAGTVRYSNIAQLQLDDCVIVCNKEVMEVLGQREVLRLLYEAEDQADAAGMIMAEASSKLPGVPLQIMIGFVESIISSDRSGRFGFGRGQLETTTGHQTFPITPDSTGKSTAAAGALVSGVSAAAGKKTRSAGTAAGSQKQPSKPQDGYDAYADQESLEDEYDESIEDDFENSFENNSRGRKIAFYLIIAAVCVGSLFAIYNMLFGAQEVDSSVTTTTTAAVTEDETNGSPADEDDPQATADPDETEPGNTEDPDLTDAAGDPDGADDDGEPAETTAETTTEQTTTQAATTAETTAEQTTTQAETTADVSFPYEYEVVSGDLLGVIARNFYGSDNPDIIDRIVAENDLADPDSIFPGDILILPEIP